MNLKINQIKKFMAKKPSSPLNRKISYLKAARSTELLDPMVPVKAP